MIEKNYKQRNTFWCYEAEKYFALNIWWKTNFQKFTHMQIWCTLFSCYLRFRIHLFTLSPTNYLDIFNKMCYISSSDKAEKIILAEKKLNTYFLNGRLKQTSDTWLVLISSNILEYFFFIAWVTLGRHLLEFSAPLNLIGFQQTQNQSVFNETLTLCKAYETLSAIWYHLYNLKNVKNTHGEVLLFKKSNTPPRIFLTLLNCTNYTKLRKAS